MKELIEKEILRQGYTILRWKRLMTHGWGIKVEKDGYYTTLFADEVMYEILERELR